MTEIVEKRLSIVGEELILIERAVVILSTLDLTSLSYSDILLLVKGTMSGMLSIEQDVTNFNDIGRRVKTEFKSKGIPLLYDASDNDLMLAMQQASLSNMQGVRASYEHKLTQLLYSSKSIDNKLLPAQLSALILPEPNVAGRSMLSVLDTEVDTFTMEVDATLMLKKGDEAGVTKYKYIGNLIGDSRPWCVSHVGKVFTREQITAWAGISWQGKKSGDPFIVRGGWRCRHHFSPVIGI